MSLGEQCCNECNTSILPLKPQNHFVCGHGSVLCSGHGRCPLPRNACFAGLNSPGDEAFAAFADFALIYCLIYRPGETLNSATGLPARVQIPVPPSVTSRLFYELLGRVRLGFLVVSPIRIAFAFLHVEQGRSSKRVWRSPRKKKF
jgi:hypothetical protein